VKKWYLLQYGRKKTDSEEYVEKAARGMDKDMTMYTLSWTLVYRLNTVKRVIDTCMKQSI
jgi:hypothetical protein